MAASPFRATAALGLGLAAAALALATAGAAKAPALPTINDAGLAAYSFDVDSALSDEFDGSTLAKSKWDRSLPGWTGTAPGFFADANAVVGQSKLTLKTTPATAQPVDADAECDCGLAAERRCRAR